MPEDSPILGSDGALYGTTRMGGTFGRGAVYRFQPNDSSYLVLRHFVGGSDGGSRMGSAFLQADDGRLYGLALNPRLVLYSLAADGSDFRLVFTTFPLGAEQGGVFGRINWLRAGPDGLFYGIYVTGARIRRHPPERLSGSGVMGADFKCLSMPVVTESGHYRAPMFESSDGFLYGAAGEDGFGTESFLWRIRKDGTGWQVLRRMFFNGRGTNGMVEALDGFLYSFTTNGPSGHDLFRIAKDGSGFALVHAFPTNEGFPLTPITPTLRGQRGGAGGTADRCPAIG